MLLLACQEAHQSLQIALQLRNPRQAHSRESDSQTTDNAVDR